MNLQSLRGLLVGVVCATGVAGLLLVQPAVADKRTIYSSIVPGGPAQLSVVNVTVLEGKDAVFKISISRAFDFPIRYAYRTEDGTARADSDYEANSGHVVFPAGGRFAEIRVKTLKDSVNDGTEDFKLVLSEPETEWGHQGWWTDYWYIEGLPDTKTVRAWIRNLSFNWHCYWSSC
ncbi:MAG: hypothetical protein OXC63_01720 [Aestuariivita sp.]|nr:hypothetical protein [Aestuariivita sp.]MCY4346526.1 hypothetical protein [Aestuariivita sp.]